MIVDYWSKPHAFKGETGAELECDYLNNWKAWMAKSLIDEWLHRFPLYVGCTPRRKVSLQLDNCSAHGKQNELPKLDNVRDEFMSPKTTSKIQPLDGSVIAWVKARYRRRLLLLVLDNIDVGMKSVYNVDILRQCGGRSRNGRVVRWRLLRIVSPILLSISWQWTKILKKRWSRKRYRAWIRTPYSTVWYLQNLVFKMFLPLRTKIMLSRKPTVEGWCVRLLESTTKLMKRTVRRTRKT